MRGGESKPEIVRNVRKDFASRKSIVVEGPFALARHDKTTDVPENGTDGDKEAVRLAA